MATKTLILRPIGVTLVPGAEGKTETSVNPSDTPEDQYHLLLSESVADDYVTCIILKSARMIIQFENIPSGFSVKEMKYYIAYAYGKSNDSTSTGTMGLTLIDSEGTTLVDVISSQSGSYEVTQIFAWDNTHSNFEKVVNEWENISFEFYTRTAYSDSFYITQVYLELTYEEPEVSTTSLYLRENGAWDAVSGAIYRKENGVWIETDDTVFTQGDKFALNVIT